MINFTWEKFDRPELEELRREFNLEEVVAAGNTEFERQLLLKDWVTGFCLMETIRERIIKMRLKF